MKQRVLRTGMPRDPRATTYLMGFVVSTVLTILILRAALALAGYPQVGGGGLHIAHELWGGLLMGLAIVLAMSFIGQVVRPYVAIIAGIGFGLFLDEVGKFVTSTNDYFFRPALAIIYVTVVVFVLLVHWVHGRRATTPAEFLAAAMAEVCAAAGSGFSDHRRERALRLVTFGGDQPGAEEVRALIAATPRGRQLPDPLVAMRVLIQRLGRPIVQLPILRRLTVGLLVTLSILQLIAAITLTVGDIFDPAALGEDVNNIASIGSTVTASLAAICVIIGLRRIRRDRRAAYGWFERAVLVNLLLTQVFAVTANQFLALPSIVIDLLMLAVLGAARGQFAVPAEPNAQARPASD